MIAKILMVCLGNICRSPLAEGILKSKLSVDFFVDSAGIGGWHQGEQPDPRAMQVAQENGIDISNQRARKFDIQDFDTFDYIYAMDNDNLIALENLAPNQAAKAKIKLFLTAAYPNETKNVPDPYYGTLSDFKNVFHLVNEASEIIAEKIIKTANP